MSLDDKIRSIEEAVNKVEELGDVLDGIVTDFTSSMSSSINSLEDLLEDMFSETFEKAANNFSQEFRDAAQDVKKSLNEAFDIDLSPLKGELSNLAVGGMATAGAGAASPATGAGSIPGIALNFAKGMKGGLFGVIIQEGLAQLDQGLQDVADANKIASMFRQVGQKAGTETVLNISGKLKALGITLQGSTQDMIAVYASAIEGGFTESELQAGETTGGRGVGLAERFFLTDQFLGLSAGGSARIGGQLKELTDTANFENVTDKIIEMKVAAEATGVSFNRFSNAALKISSSLRPLGLDISDVTNGLANMATYYRDTLNMSDERAFATASDAFGGMMGAVGAMDLGAMAGIVSQFGSPELRGMLGTGSPLEMGAKLKLLFAGGGEFQGEDRASDRVFIVNEVAKALENAMRDSGANTLGERQLFLKSRGFTELQAEAFTEYIRLMNQPGVREEDLEKARQEMLEVLADDKDNISAIKTISESMKGLLTMGIPMLISIGMKAITLLDNIAGYFGVGLLDSGTKANMLLFSEAVNESFNAQIANFANSMNSLFAQIGQATLSVPDASMLDPNSEGNPLTEWGKKQEMLQKQLEERRKTNDERLKGMSLNLEEVKKIMQENDEKERLRKPRPIAPITSGLSYEVLSTDGTSRPPTTPRPAWVRNRTGDE